MLVIISDLHLTDGSSGQTIRTGAFKAFRERLRDLAYDASWRADDRYEPIEELHLVLLGDILDIIRSSKWCGAPPNIRPWGDVNSDGFQKMVADISRGILANEVNQESLAVLKSLNDGKTITVPKATEDGRGPALVSRDPAARDRVPVTVNIYYLVGNHDWFYHLPASPVLNDMRNAVIDAIGLKNPRGTPFPHDPAEWPELLQIYQAHRVFARHGDIYDAFNFEGNRNASSLGDAIVVELLNRFPAVVAEKMGDQLSKACLAGLREIDNVRPLLIIPVWIDGLLRTTCTSEQCDQVKHIWDQMVDAFLKVPFVQQHRSIFHPLNSVGELELALKFSKGVSLANLSKLVSWARARFGGSQEDVFYPHAFSEQAFQDGSGDFVVYGHTHHYEVVPLRAIPTGGAPQDQIYINSGTWRAVHELALFEPNKQEFVGYHVMTYLTFFRGDERKKRQFETWSGSLDTSAE